MTKLASETDRPTNSIPNSPYSPKQHKPPRTTISSLSLYSPKLSLYLLATCVSLFILFQIKTLQTPPSSTSPPPPPSSWSFIHQWQCNTCTQELRSLTSKLRHAVTFLPLKDLRYSKTALQGHTWFMSSMYDTHEEGEVQYQKFPSNPSKGRVLCIKGRDNHDGARNYYGLAWTGSLPYNATLMKGLTFVSYNHYNYDNIWHGLSAVVPFVGWHIKNGCAVPSRWILYHWGELRFKMGPWLMSLMEATFGGPLYIERFDHDDDLDDHHGGDGEGEGGPVNCFEEAVVMRHNEGGMSRERRMEVYDVMRCKARMYCNVSLEGRGAEVSDRGLPVIGMTMFMRTGPRSFRNESAVVGIFDRECRKVAGCRLMVAYSNNLTFCEQVKLMSLTDILISPHGAQLTNMFLMDRNSSVMEFFPKGWLKLAGVGQYVYHWIASWSGMNHRGAWRDPNGDHCPYPDDDRRCMSIYKSGMIGFNETYFGEWARDVINEVKMRKIEEASKNSSGMASSSGCACS